MEQVMSWNYQQKLDIKGQNCINLKFEGIGRKCKLWLGNLSSCTLSILEQLSLPRVFHMSWYSTSKISHCRMYKFKGKYAGWKRDIINEGDRLNKLYMIFKKKKIQTNESITIKCLDARLNSRNLKLNHRCV